MLFQTWGNLTINNGCIINPFLCNIIIFTEWNMGNYRPESTPYNCDLYEYSLNTRRISHLITGLKGTFKAPLLKTQLPKRKYCAMGAKLKYAFLCDIAALFWHIGRKQCQY